MFDLLYDLLPTEDSEEHEVELIRLPPAGRDYYEVSASPEDVITDEDDEVQPFRDKSFHLDTYCFDSKPEKTLFWDLLQQNKVKRIYFTGMLTHGQSDFYIQYIDPDSHMVRSYYPDFLFQKEDGTFTTAPSLSWLKNHPLPKGWKQNSASLQSYRQPLSTVRH